MKEYVTVRNPTFPEKRHKEPPRRIKKRLNEAIRRTRVVFNISFPRSAARRAFSPTPLIVSSARLSIRPFHPLRSHTHTHTRRHKEEGAKRAPAAERVRH